MARAKELLAGEKQEIDERIYVTRNNAKLTLTETVGEGGGEGEGVLNRALARSRLCKVAFLVLGKGADRVLSFSTDDTAA